MKKILLCFIIVITGLISCRKSVKKIDITTQKILAGEKIPLRVTHISPVGSVEGRMETFKILIGFNQAMTALQAIPRDETDGPIEFKPKIKGKYRWLGARTLSFIPAETLKPATLFRAKLNKNKIQSLTGMRLERDTSWTFETVRPYLNTSIPYHNAEFINTRANIYLYFNLEMQPRRVRDRIKIYAHYGKPSNVWCGPKKPSSPEHREEIKFKIRNLSDKEKKDWPLKEWENKKVLVLTPKKPFPQEAEIEVQLKEGLLAREGDLGLAEDRSVTFRTFNFLTLIDHSEKIPAGRPIKFCFSNAVNIEELVKNMGITPPVKIPEEYLSQDYGYTEVYLYLPFKPNSSYRITINKNLKDQYGNRLDKDYDLTLEVGDYLPYADIPTGINVVEGKGDLRLPATFCNVDEVHLQLGTVNINEAIPFLNSPDIFNPYKKYVRPGFFRINRPWRTGTFTKYRNRRIRLPIELKEVLGGKQSGLVFVQFDNLGANQWNPDYRYLKSFLITGDLGITWKYSPENNLVWVTSLANTRPVSDVTIQLRDDNNRILFTGTTDMNGLCELPGWASALIEEKQTYEYESEYEMESYTERYEPKFWITAVKNGEEAVYSNRWHFGIDPWRFDISYNWEPRSEEYGADLFTEKGLYKSGETVYIKGIIRKKRRGEWILPDLSSVKFIVKNSRGIEIINKTVRVNSFGAFVEEISLPVDAPTGLYSVYAILPGKDYTFNTTFNVEAFRPAEFEVKVKAEKDTFLADEIFKGTVVGRYLFGMGMKEADVEWNLRKSNYYPDYPQYSGYTIGQYYFEDYGREILGSGRGRLDVSGELKVEVRLPAQDIKVPALLTLEGSVTAPNRVTLSGRQNW
ncbi:MAG: Ig-like domain-containing protein, partial [candidate division WOR-3 bacterium]